MKSIWRVALLGGLLVSITWAQPPQPGQRPSRLPPGFPRPGQPAAITDPLLAPPRATSAASVDLSGTWKGLYIGDDVVIRAELVLTTDATKRILTGDLRFSAPPGPGVRGPAPAPGSSRITGIVDPGTRAVTLATTGEVKPGPRKIADGPPGQQTRLHAVYSAARDELAGQFQGPYGAKSDAPFFIFARGDDGVKRIEQVAARVAAALPGGHGPIKPSGSIPGDEALAKWGSKLGDEFGKNGIAGDPERMFLKALPLFSDANFKPVFGETYDAIDHGTLVKAAQRLGGTDPRGGARPDPQFVRDYGQLQYLIVPSGPKMLAVAAARTIDAWEAEMLTHFKSDPPVASSFEDLAATGAAIKERVTYAWPSGLKAADAALEGAKTGLGAGALASKLDRALSEAQGLPGARALAAWPKDNEAMLKACTPAEREEAQKRLGAKLDSMLDGLLVEPLGRLDKLGTGWGALRDGAAWYTNLMRDFGFAMDRPPVQAAIARLSARREKDYTAGLEAILQRIAAATTGKALDAVLEPDLSVPGDTALASYAPIAEAAKKRRLQIDHDFQMSLFSAQERGWMDPPESGHIDVKKHAGEAPDAESIRLAILRGYAFGTGKLLDGHAARSVTRTQSLMLPFSAIMTMSDEKLESFVPVEGTSDFACSYTAVLQVGIAEDNLFANWDAVVKKNSEEMVRLINQGLRAAAGMSNSQTFRLYEDGWGVPSMRAQGAAEAAVNQIWRVP